MRTYRSYVVLSAAVLSPVVSSGFQAGGQAASLSPAAAVSASIAAGDNLRPASATHATSSGALRVQVSFIGGYETDPRDGGRPVSLVAGGLGVPSEVFRAAFRGVRPAPAGQQPESGQVRRNKDALLRALGPYGVTNEWLDEVSNYYRYNRSRGEMWPTTPAAAYATVRNGTVTEITVTRAGSGYSSRPRVSVPGYPNVRAMVTLSFGKRAAINGAIAGITLDASPARVSRTPSG